MPTFARQWSPEKLATINDASLWEVNREKPCRKVGCRVCPELIIKHTDAVRAHPIGANKDPHDGFMHLACAEKTCAEAIARADARTAEYHQKYGRCPAQHGAADGITRVLDRGHAGECSDG